jgi:MFS family permease
MAPSTLTVTKRSIGFLLGMCSLMLGANVVWVSYITILLPTLVEKVVTQQKGLVVGLIGFFGTLLAVLVSILWGIISDHASSRMGKRSPSILAGALLSLPFIALPVLILSPSTATILLPLALPIIIFSFMGMEFFTNVSNGAWWPLLVDVVPEHQRGLASGINGFLTLLGAVIAFLVVTSLNQVGQTGLALWLVGGIFALTGVISTLVLRGKDLPAPPSQNINPWQAMGELFKVRTRVVVFFWLVLALLLANMGVNSLQFFARYFFEVYFPATNPDAALRLMGGISLVFTMLAAVGSGFLSDKIGRRAMILWAMFVCAICTLFMGLVDNFTIFLVLIGLRSIATGPILATAPALASDLSPKDEAGHYMAYNNLSTGLSGGIASLIFGLLLVNMTRTTFTYVFIISAILFAIGGVIFYLKVSQKALDAHLKAPVEQVGEVL